MIQTIKEIHSIFQNIAVQSIFILKIGMMHVINRYMQEGECVMWLFFAFGSALFAGITAILAKIGIKNTDSNVATAIRTIVILMFC